MDWSGIKIVEKSNFYRIYNYEIKCQNAMEKSLLNSFFIISLNIIVLKHIFSFKSLYFLNFHIFSVYDIAILFIVCILEKVILSNLNKFHTIYFFIVTFIIFILFKILKKHRIKCNLIFLYY